jgi:hypothetical protein
MHRTYHRLPEEFQFARRHCFEHQFGPARYALYWCHLTMILLRSANFAQSLARCVAAPHFGVGGCTLLSFALKALRCVVRVCRVECVRTLTRPPLQPFNRDVTQSTQRLSRLDHNVHDERREAIAR